MFKRLNAGDYSGSTVLIASPSVGNVGQLSLDLLISTLNAEQIGMIWHKGVLPFVGANPYDESSSKICSSNDIYFCKTNRLILIQLRAPLHRKHFADYCTEIAKLLIELKTDRVIILSGMYAHQRDDSELRAGTFRFLANQKATDQLQIDGLDWTRMKGNENDNNFASPRLPGAGFTRTLYDVCTGFSMPCMALLYFCSEGDNVQDSRNLTNRVDDYLKILPTKTVIEPPSWKYLFGNETPVDFY